MSGKDLASLYRQGRAIVYSLATFAVSSGDTAINEGMQTTLAREADHFWYFNNGVTLVCDSARKLQSGDKQCSGSPIHRSSMVSKRRESCSVFHL